MAKRIATIEVHIAEGEDTIHLTRAALAISKLSRNLIGHRLRELRLYNGQDELLLALEDRAHSVHGLAERLGVTSSTVSKTVDRLVLLGLVVRTRCEDDARRVDIVLTTSGAELAVRVRELHRSVERELVRASLEKVGEFGSTLRNLRTALETTLHRTR